MGRIDTLPYKEDQFVNKLQEAVNSELLKLVWGRMEKREKSSCQKNQKDKEI